VSDDQEHSKAVTQGTEERRPRLERVSSSALLGAARELIIEHDGREYRLRLTRQGKLILTA
jgi:hemin uptake protein HemP